MQTENALVTHCRLRGVCNDASAFGFGGKIPCSFTLELKTDFSSSMQKLMFLLHGACHFSGFSTTWPSDNEIVSSVYSGFVMEPEETYVPPLNCSAAIDSGFAQFWRVLNWHPLLMTLAFGVVFVNGALAFRTTLFGYRRKNRKVAHGFLNGLSFLVATAGIVVMFLFKERTGNFDLYTIHAVVGFNTYLIFGLQWIVALVSFTAGGEYYKRAFVVVHRLVGTLLLIGTTISMLTGALGYTWVLYYGIPGTIPGNPPVPPRGWMYTTANGFSWAVILVLSVVITFFRNPNEKDPESRSLFVQK